VGRVRRHPFLAAIALLIAIGVALVGLSAITVWRAAHQDDASHVQDVDAIVVLGAAQWNGTPSPVFKGRLEQALVLWNQKRASTILVLGGKQPGDITTEGDAGKAYLVSKGVPSTSVVSIPVGNDSYGSLVAAANYLETNHMHSVFLVSDPWHNARIKRMASDLGLRAYASATWDSAYVSRRARLSGYIRETFAYLYYRIFRGR
jgi:uncharacterized SAM-binding protein YcdF (DUF218 family)